MERGLSGCQHGLLLVRTVGAVADNDCDFLPIKRTMFDGKAFHSTFELTNSATDESSSAPNLYSLSRHEFRSVSVSCVLDFCDFPLQS
jgi:hypothetical protein